MEKDKAKQYSDIKLKLTLFNFIFTFVILGAFIFFGWSQGIKELSLGFVKNEFGLIAFYYLLFFIALYLIDLPLRLYSSFYLEHRFNLSNQTLGQWFLEEVKKQTLTFALTLTVIEIIYFVMRSSPDQWWVFAWGIWILLSLVFGQLFPVLILPLFYKCSDLEDVGLKSRILDFMKSHNMKIQNVYSINLSKTTKKANAAFCGLGPTKRVLLGDTLISNFNPDEIEVVLAHELGHYKGKHLLKSLIFGAFTSLALFFFLKLAFETWSFQLGFNGIADIAAFPLLNLIVYTAGLLILPVQNSFSRQMEREADDFAIKTASVRNAFKSCMEKLAELNLADKDPHPWVEFFLYSHPSIKNRIARHQFEG